MTQKRKYTSLYGGKRKLCCSEHIGQILTARKLVHFGQPVKDRFWENPEILADMKRIEAELRRMLELYDEEVLIKVFTVGRPEIWSPFWQNIHTALQAEQNRLDKVNQIEPPEIKEIKDASSRQTLPQNSTLLNKLKD